MAIDSKKSPQPAATHAGKQAALKGLSVFHDEEPIRKNHDFRLLRRLAAFVAPHKKIFWLSMIAIALSAAITVLQPVVMGRVASHAQHLNVRALWQDGIALAVLMLMGQLINLAHTLGLQKLGIGVTGDLRAAVFAHVHRLRLRFLDQTPVGRLVTRVTGDVETIGEIFSSGILQSFGDVLALVGIVVAMLWLDVRLALVTFATFPLVSVLVLFIRQRAKQIYREVRVRTARLNSFFNEQVQGVSVVQAYGREAAIQAEFRPINDAHRDANKQSVFYESVLDAAVEMLTTLCIASLLWWMGFYKLGTRPASFGLVVTFVQFVRRFFEPISALAQRYTLLQNALSGAERVFGLLDEKDVEDEIKKQDLLLPDPAAPAIVFDRVSFGYRPEYPVLRDISFSIQSGQIIALVGATGAGKTTITSLLLRLYEISAGRIDVFGHGLHKYTLDQLRALFSVVPQDVLLFPGTWLSNIALGDPHPNRPRAEAALQQMGLQAWLDAKPDGLDTPIQERGGNLSVGERQCIALARALYRDAPIVILDEATASIDSSTEQQLQQAWTAALQGRTALIIAHRLSTIQNANCILVFHKGHLVESGSHKELMGQDGLYRRLHRMQSSHQQ